MELTQHDVLRWLELYAQEIEGNSNVLTELDRAIGDGDHGINMNRGFRAVKENLPTNRDKPIDAVLKDTGMTLIRTVGGAAGPLYGTVFLRMAQAVSDKESLDEEAVGAMLAAGQQGIVDRGKASVGDKTMLDTWAPAVEAFQGAATEMRLDAATTVATTSADTGMRRTKPLVARKGRASYLGDRSVGHVDPGAASSYLLFRALMRVGLESVSEEGLTSTEDLRHQLSLRGIEET